jgi:hypothetical protein
MCFEVAVQRAKERFATWARISDAGISQISVDDIPVTALRRETDNFNVDTRPNLG